MGRSRKYSEELRGRAVDEVLEGPQGIPSPSTRSERSVGRDATTPWPRISLPGCAA